MKSLLVSVILIASTSAFAQGVKVKKAMDASLATIATSAAKVKAACGTDIANKLDDSFSASEQTANTGAWCNATLDAIATLCKDADYKAAIVKSVKKVVCKYDASVTKEMSYGNKFDLSGGSLTHSFNEKSFNLEDKTSEFLKGKL